MIWNVDPVLLNLGTIQVRYYGVCLLITLIGGYGLWRWQILRSGRSVDCARSFRLPGLIGMLIGGRIGHLVFYDPQLLKHNPLEILFFWTGGLSSHGAAVGLVLALMFFARQQRMSFLDVADRLTFSCAWLGWVRVGNLFNSEIVGRVTDLPWGVRFPRYDHQLPIELVPLRHPAQLYEAAMAFSLLGVLVLIDRLAGRETRPLGLLAYSFLVLLFLGRFSH